MPKIHDVKQGTEEWLKLRLGKFTASHAQAIANQGKGLDTLCLELAAERLSRAKPESFSNEDIERGHELEDSARFLYESQTGKTVSEVGFISMGEFIGCSPDGLIDEEGGVEIKCPNDNNFLKVVLDDFIDSKYQWQIQFSLFVTGRKWWDYVVYNPNFERPIFISRVNPDEKMIKDISDGIILGEKKIQDILKKWEMKNAHYS